MSSPSGETKLDDFLQPDIESLFLRSLVYVTLKIRQDTKDMPGHSAWNDIDEDHVKSIIPESLFLMLRLLFDGHTFFDEEGTSDAIKTARKRNWIFSIPQDLIFGVSGGRKLTPKHVGLGMTIHQATRSKQLVDLLHEGCHSVSYEMVRRIDTSISDHVLERFEENENVFIPRGIQQGKFAHFSADNVDILEETLDGKNTFHATQMAVWQRGTSTEDDDGLLLIGKDKTLRNPLVEEMHSVLPVHVPKQRTEPTFQAETPQYENIFHEIEDTVSDSRSKDLAWLISRVGNVGVQGIPSWSGFNRSITSVSPDITTTGFLPIIQQPAHKNKVIPRCMDITKHLGQKNTVITVDQALYCKLKELVWLKDPVFSTVVVRLGGGLHIALNFLKCIGHHMESAGLEDIWIEGGLYNENTTQAILSGKMYNHAVRAHKLTFEALWRVYWSGMQRLLAENDRTINLEVTELANSIVEAFLSKNADAKVNTITTLSAKVKSMMEFKEYNADSPTFKFWRQYMKMVEIILGFTREEREGNWQLHLSSFAAMLPYFAMYDHINYAKWGPVYLMDMALLSETAPDVYRDSL